MSDLPKTLTFDANLSKKAAEKRRLLNEGFVRCVVTRGENREGKNKDESGNPKVSRLQIVLTLAPLKNPKDPKTAVHDLALRKYLVLPYRSTLSPDVEDVAEEEAKQTGILSMLTQDLRALLGPEVIPYNPRKTPAGTYEFDGEEIEANEYADAKIKINDKVQKEINAYWVAPERWVASKKSVWVKLVQRANPVGELQADIGGLYLNLPEDTKPLPFEDWMKSPTK